ncbi:hypothetical protein SteCoe_13176 [Stentor coeruleus]|uniref:SAM domain-containing protein n=1 Tax=Stentor coeruleus TaxID=5963 RepID=A0A1R2C947_9CILI|nr:hypothetical protein SteCoe_13176 [Stentor coeruleus]
MEDSITEKILSAAGLSNDYLGLFKKQQIEGEVWVELSQDHLQSIGITNKFHVQQILTMRNSLFGITQPQTSTQEELKIESTPELQISLNSVIRLARLQTKNKTDSSEVVMRKVKSLDFSGKKLTHIVNLDSCITLQFLSLSNNSIQQINGLSSLKQLRILSLESNLIQKLENLESLSLLEKLYLDCNFIKRIENLENQSHLQELSLNRQQLSGPLEIDENSIVAVSHTLHKLYLSGNQLSEIGTLWYLDSISEIDLSNNNIHFCEDLYKMLSCMKYLAKLKLVGNPVAKRQKYRDEMILWSNNLQELDDKNILANEKEYLYRLKGKRLSTFPKNNNIPGVELEVKGNRMNN